MRTRRDGGTEEGSVQRRVDGVLSTIYSQILTIRLSETPTQIFQLK